MLLEGKLKRRWSDGVITFFPCPIFAFWSKKHNAIIKHTQIELLYQTFILCVNPAILSLLGIIKY